MKINHSFFPAIITLALGACTIDEPAISALERNKGPSVIDVHHTHILTRDYNGKLSPLAIVEASDFVELTAPNHGDKIIIKGGSSVEHKMLMRLITPNKSEIFQYPDKTVPMTVHITKATLKLKECGQRETDPSADDWQTTPWDAGCATRNNLARMLDAPGDLRQGRPSKDRASDPEVILLQGFYDGTLELEATPVPTNGGSGGE